VGGCTGTLVGEVGSRIPGCFREKVTAKGSKKARPKGPRPGPASIPDYFIWEDSVIINEGERPSRKEVIKNMGQ